MTTLIEPIYITKLGPKEKASTNLNAMYIDQQYLKGLIDLSLDMKSNSQIIKSSTNEIKNTFSDAKTILNDMSNAFNELNETFISKIQDVNVAYDKYADKVLFYANIPYIILIAANLGLFCLFFCIIKCSWARFFNHVLWNIIILYIIVMWFAGGFIGLFGVIGGDISGIFKYSISSSNLQNNSIIFPQNTSQYLDTCFNGDGNLANGFNLTIGPQASVSKLIKDSLIIYDLTQNQTNIIDSPSSNAHKKFLELMRSDIRQTFNPSSDLSPSYQFGEWFKYTDYLQSPTYQNSCGIQDIWVQSYSSCAAGYSLLAYNDNPKEKLGEKNCLIISNWEKVIFVFKYI